MYVSSPNVKSERKYEEKRIIFPFVSLQSCPDYPWCNYEREPVYSPGALVQGKWWPIFSQNKQKFAKCVRALRSHDFSTMAFARCIQLRLTQLLRERVLDLHHDGMNPQLIADEVLWGTMISTTRLCPKWEKRNLDQNSFWKLNVLYRKKTKTNSFLN